MSRPRVWLITEIHCYMRPSGQVSVWVSGRPLSDDKTIEDDVAVKLIGPVPDVEGERMIGVLKSQLEAAGVTVIRTATADD